MRGVACSPAAAREWGALAEVRAYDDEAGVFYTQSDIVGLLVEAKTR